LPTVITNDACPHQQQTLPNNEITQSHVAGDNSPICGAQPNTGNAEILLAVGVSLGKKSM
jgi:hypothetical protein